jgi:pimeloyl-ACP methyl ester carboxylesterase
MSDATSRAAAKRAATGQDATQISIPLTSVHKVEVDGVHVFYRAAGEPNAPVVLLLHGFPTSSFMFRDLIPRLAGDYRVIAPDLPGFGFTEVPAERKYLYSFDQLALTIDAFTRALKLDRYAIYVFDYGAPTGFRLAMAHPERVKAIVSQNGNAYEEGLGDAWAPIRKYWAEPTPQNRDILRQSVLTAGGTRWQYTHGVANPESVAPESYTLDTALLERAGNKEIQLDLFLDYASNVRLYPKFQEYFRKSQPPLLAIWGKNDPFCDRDARGGNRFRHEGLPGGEWHYAPDARERGSTMSSFPQDSSIVLVHGAWADGSCWSNVVLPLERQGLKVMCAPIPLTSFPDDVAALSRTLERTTGPVVLVGHAYAGAVIAAVREERVKSLVYIAALAPDEGETVAKVFHRDEPHPQAPKLPPDTHGFIWMPDAGFQHAVAHKASADQTSIAAAVQRPLALQCIQEPVPAPAWRTKPTWFLIAEEDRMISPKTQHFMAERMGANIRTSHVDHSPMYTAPDLVVDVILEAARASLSDGKASSRAVKV